MKTICRSTIFTLFLLNFTGCGLGTTTSSGNNNNNTITEDPTNGGEFTPAGSETGLLAYRKRPSTSNCPTGNSLPVFTDTTPSNNGVFPALADSFAISSPEQPNLRLGWMSSEKNGDQTLKVRVSFNSSGIRRSCGPSSGTVATASKFSMVCAQFKAQVFKSSDGVNYQKLGNSLTVNLQNAGISGYSCASNGFSVNSSTPSTYNGVFNLGQNGLGASNLRVRITFVKGKYCGSLTTSNGCSGTVSEFYDSSFIDDSAELYFKGLEAPLEVTLAGSQEYIE